MPGQSSQDLFSQAVDLFAQRVDEYASGIANRLGQPMSGSQLNKDQVLERWNYSPVGDTAQADAQYHQLVAQGTPPGQALDQTYPFRKMLFTAPDLKGAIDKANQIAGWHADATGQPAPESNPQQSPILQQAPQQLTPPPMAGVPSPLGSPGPGPGLGLNAPPGAPGSIQGPSPMPPSMPAQALGQMPSVAPGPMPPIQPVPGVS